MSFINRLFFGWFMARRRTRKKPTRRRTRSFNVLNAAEMYLQTNVLTQGFAGVNPIEFVTGQEYGITGASSNPMGGKPTAKYGFAYRPQNISVTIPEIMGMGSANLGDGISALVENGKSNWLNMLIGTVGVKAGFAVAKKITSKQRSFINNQVMKPLGLKSMVRV